MGKKLAGITFIRNGVLLDYCFEAAVHSLQAICDHVFVVYVEGDDNTLEALEAIGGITLITCARESWDEIKGKEKLSYFQNIGIQYAQQQGFDYCLLVQGDEVIHESSFPYIKRAVELGEESFFVSRINLWGSSRTQLNVPQARKPVSSVVNRLTKTSYRSVDDGESIAAPASLDFINLIRIYHMGFVRDKHKHCNKVRVMQEEVFGFSEMDKRVRDMNNVFDPWIHFAKEDVLPIEEELPVFVREWAAQRDRINEDA
jgi:hypothetical protein